MSSLVRGDDEAAYEVCGALLAEVRRRAGLTQYDLAGRLGVKQPLISKIENGDRRLDVVELFHVCSACQAVPEEFVRRLGQALSAAGGRSWTPS